MARQCTFEQSRHGRTRVTRVSLMREGERISGLEIWHLPMRIGSCEVHLGGIADVQTHRAHRKQGHASVVMRESVDWMQAHGVDVSVLFGIPGFYWRWGYVTTLLAATTAQIPTRQAEQVRRTARPRRFRATDMDDALRVYNRDNARRTGTIVRRKSTWTPWRTGIEYRAPNEVYLYPVRGRVGAVAGFTLRADKVACAELSIADPAACGAVLRHAADLAVARRVETVLFHLPPDHAFADYLREQGCDLRVHVPRVAGGMARVMNQQTTFRKIAPELCRRLAESRFHAWSGTVAIRTDLGTTRLVVNKGAVRVGESKDRADVRLRVSQERLTQLLFGFQPVSFLLAHTDTRLTGRDARELLGALFPRGEAYMWWPDRF